MRYWREFVDEKTNCVYSCDMVRLNVEIRKNSCEDFTRLFSRSTRIDVEFKPISFAGFRYKHVFTVSVGDSAVKFGFCLNCAKDGQRKGFIEFNPNKVFPEWQDEFLTVCGMCCSIEVVRCDIAIDIPVERTGVSLLKDIRQYRYLQEAEGDYTEYLGKRNHPGYVKLYNKAIEQKLKFSALTRLEITTEPDIASFRKHLPEVAISYTEQLIFSDYDLSGLSHNDRVYVSLLNTLPHDERMAWVQKLTYREKKKITPYIFGNNRFQPCLKCVSGVLMEVNKFPGFCA